MRRHYTIEDVERVGSIEQALIVLFAVFRRQGYDARVSGGTLVLSAANHCRLAHMEEMAERAIKANGFHLKFRAVDDF